ncbi:MAG: SDR family oxidoreductase [Thermoleophilia bacterium]|nr:SDR family oxidoreductase [Thermoleophilia bacterium]
MIWVLAMHLYGDGTRGVARGIGEERVELGIAGRIALVTGGSRGIGRAAAESLAREGATVVVGARGAEGVDAAVAQLRAAGATAEGIVVDMADPLGPADAVARAQAVAGPVDIVVANAGGPPPGRFVDADDDGWDLAVQQNLLGTVRLIRAALPGMRERGWGRIVTITSTSVREVIDGLALSNATRAGVAGAVRTLAREVAEDGVTVNNVLPGPILTDRMRQLLSAQPDLDVAIAARGAQNPTGRVGDPGEVGDLVAFLASDRAAFINGASVMIDGGESRVVG